MIVIDPLAIPFVILIGALFGLTVFTSVYMARNGSALYFPLWFLVFDGSNAEIVFSIALTLVYLAAIRPDLREESRIRVTTGFSEKGWFPRLRKATTDFFSREHS